MENEELDQLGAALLKSALLPDDEIKRIIDQPQLFNSVLTRIESMESRNLSPPPNTPETFFDRYFSFPVGWKSFSGATAILTVFVFALSLLILFGIIRFSQNEASQNTLIADSSSSFLQAPAGPSFQEGESQNRFQDSISSTVKFNKPVRTLKLEKSLPESFVKPSRGRSSKNISRPSSSGPRPAIGDEGRFYPLTYAVNPEESMFDKQIIRVEISRAELLSIGANLSPGHDNERFKTDLLIGLDGMPIAFRPVK